MNNHKKCLKNPEVKALKVKQSITYCTSGIVPGVQAIVSWMSGVLFCLTCPAAYLMGCIMYIEQYAGCERGSQRLGNRSLKLMGDWILSTLDGRSILVSKIFMPVMKISCFGNVLDRSLMY